MKLSSIPLYLKVISELGYDQVFYNLVYKLGLRSGYYRFQSIFQKSPTNIPISLDLLPRAASLAQVKTIIGETGISALLEEADEIVAGKFRQFGADLAPIDFDTGKQSLHWTDIELGKAESSTLSEDVKLTWESARFGWALILGRAFALTSDEKYATSFWDHLEKFKQSNPANYGPNWSSGQEVAIRLLCILWAAAFLKDSTVSKNKFDSLYRLIDQHAQRIQQTLVYARSQNNNHYLSESAALITAAQVLPTHPSSSRWYSQGWAGINWCLRTQIDLDGEYVQHSNNYHRLMLQICLWIFSIDQKAFNPEILKQLSKASEGLACQLDPISGYVPNLGANDGAIIFPLYCGDFSDFRSIVQASLNIFTSYTLPAGKWDEMLAWYGLPLSQSNSPYKGGCQGRLSGLSSWISLRTKVYTNRPSHADHLHAEVWWAGQNIATDPGTYGYNSTYPWNNSLISTLVHNTVRVDEQDQMVRMGKFLLAEWGASRINENTIDKIVATSDAYHRLGVDHSRCVSLRQPDQWEIEDTLSPIRQSRVHRYDLHWLLTDLPWHFELSDRLKLFCETERGRIILDIQASEPIQNISIIRAGKNLAGDLPCLPYQGWISPTYSKKLPAWAITVRLETASPCHFTSRFQLPVLP